MAVNIQCEIESQKMRNVTKSGSTSRAKKVTEASPLLHSALYSDDDTSSANSDVLGTGEKVRSCMSRCRTSCGRRPLPKGKGLLLLLFVYAAESFAFYCATKSIRELLFKDELKQAWRTFLYSLIYNSLGRVFYPFAGVLADTFWGRYKVIKIGLWLIAVGLGLICINLSIVDSTTESVGRIALPIVCILFISIGSACVEVNTVSFGVDQLPQGCTSDQISSYFLWYYFTRNASSLLAVIVFLIFQSIPHFNFLDESNFHYISHHLHTAMMQIDLHFKTLIVILVSAGAIVLGLFLHLLNNHWYFKNSQRENPVKTVINVSWYSLTVKRHLPVYRKTFRYGEGKKPRIELAKKEFDGIFEAEEVENVKSFYQILFLILSLGGFLASNNGAASMLTAQFGEEELIKLSNSYRVTAPFLNNLINTITIIVFLPFFNHVVLPFFPRLSMSIKLRLVIGLILNLLAILIAVILQATVEENRDVSGTKFLWLLLPAIVLSVAESLTFVSCLEFIYAQAPEPMKGLLTGLFYFMFGVFSGISSIIFYCFPFHVNNVHDNIKQDFVFWFYVLLLIVAALGLLVYALVAWFYQNRLRPAVDEEDLTHRIFAQNVFFPNNQD